MALNYERLKSFKFPEIEQTYTERDVMLYALSVGYGSNPLDEADLTYVYEKALKPAPTFALTLGFFSISKLDLGINYTKVVHSAQGLRLHATLPSNATIVCKTHISDVWDLGADKGAILRIVRNVYNKADGLHLATTTMDAMCRADGGFGGPKPPEKPAACPMSAPTYQEDVATLPQQALLYRLSGDFNPLHVDPSMAKKAGFSRPILHGLANYGIAVREVLKRVCNYEDQRIIEVSARFTAPFFPGETLRIDIWDQPSDNKVQFRASVVERSTTVLDFGSVLLTG